MLIISSSNTSRLPDVVVIVVVSGHLRLSGRLSLQNEAVTSLFSQMITFGVYSKPGYFPTPESVFENVWFLPVPFKCKTPALCQRKGQDDNIFTVFRENGLCVNMSHVHQHCTMQFNHSATLLPVTLIKWQSVKDPQQFPAFGRLPEIRE